ncbi:hypothetical protein ACFL36_04055 [Thermodesulfobacteriota bacterium]
MDIFYIIWINFVPIALLLIMVGMWPMLRRQFPQPLLFDLVVFFVVVKIVMIFLIPAFLRAVSDWELDRVIGAGPSEIAINYTIEFASYLIWLLSIWFVSKLPGVKRIFRNINDDYNKAAIAKREGSFASNEHYIKDFAGQKHEGVNRQAKLFMVLLFGLYLFYFLSHKLPLLASLYHFRPIALLSVFFEWAAMMSGPVVAIYIFSLRRKSVGNFTFFLGVGVAAVSMIHALGSGSRAQIVGPALWLIFMYLFVSRKKIILYGAICGLVMVLLLHSVMLDVRAMPKFGDKSPIEKIGAFIDKKKAGAGRADLLSGMEFRFGEASRVSVAFLRLYNNGMAAGLKPIQSALWAPLPRRFFPGKPQPGSVDGTWEGMGMHVVQGYMRAWPWVMSDFLTGVHAYWELGWLGVALFSIISGVFVGFSARYFSHFGLAGLPLMMMVLKPWWIEPKLWVSQIILESATVLIPLVLIWYFAGFILSLAGRYKKHLAIVFTQ